MCQELSISYLIQSAYKVYPHNEVLQRVAVTQAVHESGLIGRSGPSKLAELHKNLFGIKGEGTAGSARMMTWEHIKGKNVKVREPFAKNHTYEDSFKQHAKLMGYKRYKPVRESECVYEAFEQLQKCGYATDPKYPRKLENIYNKFVRPHYQ